MDSPDLYVAEPAEPPRRAALAQRIPLIAGIILLVAMLAVGLLLFTRGSTQDPAIGDGPSPAATEPGRR